MKDSLVNLFFCAIIASQIRNQVLTDNSVQVNQQQFPQQQYRSMSCYVCSTMDYENPSDNLCRVMKLSHRSLPPNLHHQQTSSGHHYYSPTTTTTTTTATTSTTQAAMKTIDDFSSPLEQSGSGGLASSRDGELELATTITPSHNITDSTAAYLDANGQLMSNTTMPGHQYPLQQDQQQQLQTTSLAPSTAQHGHHYSHIIPQYRTPPSNFIRTRQCLDDENFCSIVSVVRLEFTNDNLYPKFWAMERNCSKSCNTGCMLIGERVRLRVCSQCCRTPNCNVGSGAIGTYHDELAIKSHQVSLVLASLILMLLYSFQQQHSL